MSAAEAAAPPSIKQLALGDLSHELATTRRVLERVPAERFSWKPHEKSSSLQQLATHVATIPFWAHVTVEQDELNFAEMPPPPPPPASTDELLARFDENAELAKQAVARADESALGKPWTARSGDHVVFTQPRLAVLRGFVISHLIHHRAQLSVYLRLLDVPVPSIYGPSADESGF